MARQSSGCDDDTINMPPSSPGRPIAAGLLVSIGMHLQPSVPALMKGPGTRRGSMALRRQRQGLSDVGVGLLINVWH